MALSQIPGGTFSQADGTTVINTILTQEAGRIGSDIYRDTVHTSPWIDLIKQSAFPDGMGYTLNTLIYDRALPLKSGELTGTSGDAAGAVGVNWADLAASTASSVTGFIDGQTTAVIGAETTSPVTPSKIDFSQRLKSYNLKRATVVSPRINIEELRFAAHRQEQLRAIMDLLKESTRYSWEERYRDEFDRVADNLVLCKATGTTITSNKSDAQTWGASGAAGKIGDVDANNDDTAELAPSANISNKILDSIYFRLVRAGAGSLAYGRENGRPVFALICSSEASYALKTEAGFRDDIRQNASRVGDLVAPLGVDSSFRGLYHICDDLAPRLAFNAATDYLERVPAYKVVSNVVVPNEDYEDAHYEVAYVMTDEICESLIPQPIGSAGSGLSFNPVNYRGDFKWLNIADAVTNPLQTTGFFLGTLASATKPLKVQFGYSIVFKRTSATPAA